MHDLQSKIRSGFTSSPAVEVGGILLGRTVKEGAETSIVILDFKPVASQTPRYNATPQDLIELGRALSDPVATTDLRSIGYFRSHLRESPFAGRRDSVFLSEQDGELIEKYLPDPSSIFLIIKPTNNGISTAGLFFWLNGRLEKEFSYSEVTIGSEESFDSQVPTPCPDSTGTSLNIGVKYEPFRQMTPPEPPNVKSDPHVGSAASPKTKQRANPGYW